MSAPPLKPLLFARCLCLCAVLLAQEQALAAPAAAVTLLAIDHAGGHSNPRAQGLSAWLHELRARTSIDVALSPRRVDLTAPHGFFDAAVPPSPLWVWQGDQAFEPLPDEALVPLARALRAGGALFVDASDGVASGPFEQSVTRELLRLFPGIPLVPIPHDHVLYRSFYLVDRHSGRTNARPELLGMTFEGRLVVVLSANDLSGAMAKDATGNWAFSATDGPRAREMATRLCINWVMYCLCLDYKADQVHLPFLLKRRH